MVKKFIVRKITESDRNALSRLFRNIEEDGSEEFHPHPFTDEVASRICRHNGADIYMVGYLDGVLVAYGMLRGFDEGYKIPMLGIYVGSTYRGIGLGKSFILSLHNQAKQLGADRVRLKVYRSNKIAIRMYRKIGYQFTNFDDHQLLGELSL